MPQVDYLVLADAVAAPDGKHYIHGGGWDTIFAPVFPAIRPSLDVALRLRGTTEDLEGPHRIKLDVVNAEGSSVVADPGAFQATLQISGDWADNSRPSKTACLAFHFGPTELKEPGEYAVVLEIDGVEQARASFWAAHLPAGADVRSSPDVQGTEPE
ncbi:MAG: hypothetical protein HY329_24040 [Chloroflexi bacterium]|nr:hypothetical protein [Chloroflexota bacterium]